MKSPPQWDHMLNKELCVSPLFKTVCLQYSSDLNNNNNLFLWPPSSCASQLNYCFIVVSWHFISLWFCLDRFQTLIANLPLVNLVRGGGVCRMQKGCFACRLAANFPLCAVRHGRGHPSLCTVERLCIQANATCNLWVSLFWAGTMTCRGFFAGWRNTAWNKEGTMLQWLNR